MKRKLRVIIFNIALAVFFIPGVILLITIFRAEALFDKAQQSAIPGKMQEAERLFGNALKTDPLNSGYYGAYAEFLSREAAGQNNKIESGRIKKAEELYGRAMQLNPHCAEYALGLGQLKVKSFLKSGNYEDRRSAFSYFKKALEEDPNGFNISYPIGYAGLSLWGSLDEKDKRFIFDRLKYSLKIKPEFARHIYPRLWQTTQDPALFEEIISKKEKEACLRLTENMKRTARASNVSNVILPENWEGTANDGINKYRNGAMCWEGTMCAAILLPHGAAKLEIQAMGTPVDGIYPYMIVKTDDEVIGGASVTSNDWKDYEFKIKSDGSIKILSVVFLNDGVDEKRKEDRNLFIGRAEANPI